MNLYLLTQDEVSGWDTYDSCVVAAESELLARRIHPNDWFIVDPWGSTAWASVPDKVKAKFLGTADDSIKRGALLPWSFKNHPDVDIEVQMNGEWHTPLAAVELMLSTFPWAGGYWDAEGVVYTCGTATFTLSGAALKERLEQDTWKLEDWREENDTHWEDD